MKKSKKSKKYMSEENFNLLVESLNQAIEYERGERNDLRVTVMPVPPLANSEAAEAAISIRDAVTQEIAGLSEAKLRQVADYIAFLNFKERRNTIRAFSDEQKAESRSLEELLAGVTEQNLHREIDYGPAVGKEVW
jgi:antitoxin component of MazEF toxin-antitoxin module